MGLDPLRDVRIREAMRAHDLDALICRLPENVLLLTGYWPLSGFAFVFYPREGPVSLVAVTTEMASVPDGVVDDVRSFDWGVLGADDPYVSVRRHLTEVIRAARLQRARIGYEGSFEAVAPGHMAGETMAPAGVTHAMIACAAPDARLVDATPALYRARARKTKTEIAKLRRANDVAALGLEAFRAYYEPGRAEAEVAAHVEAAILSQGIGYHGARHARAWTQLMTGPESARAHTPHPATSSRVIQRGDLGLLELGTVVDGYWSDLTRTLVAGASPTTRQQELYAAIMAAHAAAMSTARPGMTGADVDAVVRAEVERRGFGALFMHHTGHGLGFRYHEPHPLLHPDSGDIIEEGMVCSIEPGLYIEGFGGLRLEENVVFTETGVSLLSVCPTALTPAADVPAPRASGSDGRHIRGVMVDICGRRQHERSAGRSPHPGLLADDDGAVGDAASR